MSCITWTARWPVDHTLDGYLQRFETDIWRLVRKWIAQQRNATVAIVPELQQQQETMALIALRQRKSCFELLGNEAPFLSRKYLDPCIRARPWGGWGHLLEIGKHQRVWNRAPGPILPLDTQWMWISDIVHKISISDFTDKPHLTERSALLGDTL